MAVLSPASCAGNGRLGTSIRSSNAGVIRPISWCCGSSESPGPARQVTIKSVGMRNGAFSDVIGLTALPRPEFCNMTAVRRPASQAPEAIATASPSLAAVT